MNLRKYLTTSDSSNSHFIQVKQNLFYSPIVTMPLASNVSISLNFNIDTDAQDKNLISTLVRVTTESEIPAIKFIRIFYWSFAVL